MHRAAQALGDLDQQAVARLVTEAVVDELEVVQIQEEHGHPCSARMADRSSEMNAARSGRPVSASKPGTGMEDEG